jgi:hypothetical protein
VNHKIFDNKFFLKYIQQLGLRKISHFHSSHAGAFAPPIKQEKWQTLYHGAWCVFFINQTLNFELSKQVTR